MQKKESAERKMSKIKTKKALTPEQKKKRIRNIIIVAVILVAASVATYWMQPQNKALAESEVFSEEEVKAQAEKIIGLLNAEDFDSLQSLVVPDMQEIMNKERRPVQTILIQCHTGKSLKFQEKMMEPPS